MLASFIFLVYCLHFFTLHSSVNCMTLETERFIVILFQWLKVCSQGPVKMVSSEQPETVFDQAFDDIEVEFGTLSAPKK